MKVKDFYNLRKTSYDQVYLYQGTKTYEYSTHTETVPKCVSSFNSSKNINEFMECEVDSGETDIDSGDLNAVLKLYLKEADNV